jgi:hypothetical protein
LLKRHRDDAGGGTSWGLSDGLGGGRSDALRARLYGATRWGPAYLAAAFAFTNHWMSTDRIDVGDHLTADFERGAMAVGSKAATASRCLLAASRSMPHSRPEL